jgi:hypothetical protein
MPRIHEKNSGGNAPLTRPVALNLSCLGDVTNKTYNLLVIQGGNGYTITIPQAAVVLSSQPSIEHLNSQPCS